MRQFVYSLMIMLIPIMTSARVLVVVDSDYYNNSSYEIQGKNRVDRYVSAVRNIEEESVHLVVYDRAFRNEKENIEDLWKMLVGQYNYSLDVRDTLDGIVFIGDIPVPKYGHNVYGIISCDNVYMELYDDYNTSRYSSSSVFDSIWVIDTITGYYSNHNPRLYGGTGTHVGYDVWVSRIYAKNLTSVRSSGAPWGEFLTEYEIISNYLDKVHERMTRPADKPSRALGFGDIENFRPHHETLNPESTNPNAPSNARIGLSHGNRLAVGLLPVDSTRYIYNWWKDYDGHPHTGDHRINTASNFQSQLQAGPFGNESEGLFGELVDNRYNTLLDSAPTMHFDPSDTLGWEWVGFFEHGTPLLFECNGSHEGGGPNARGRFSSNFHGMPEDTGFQKITDSHWLSSYYYTVIRDLYSDSRKYPANLFFKFDEFADGETIDLFFWVDIGMINPGKIYNEKVWMNVNQMRVDSGEHIMDPEVGASVNAFEYANAHGQGWMPVFNNYAIGTNSEAVFASFHPTHDTSVSLDAEFPFRAVKAVSRTTGREVIKTVESDDLSFSLVKPDDRVFTKMQDDGGQSKANFFLTNSCAISNFAYKNNINLTLAMAHSGLISIGTSKDNFVSTGNGNMVQELVNGESFGNAFKMRSNRSLGWNLFGAGTLKPRPYVPFRHPEDFTEAEMLSFERINAWERTAGDASVEQKESVLDNSDRHYKVTLWDIDSVDLRTKTEITTLKGTGVSNAKIGLSVSFPEESVSGDTSSNRGTIRILFNSDIAGDIEINTNDSNIYTDTFGLCHAYYEFAVPESLVSELDTGLDSFTLRLASVNSGEWFLLKEVEFAQVGQGPVYDLSGVDAMVSDTLSVTPAGVSVQISNPDYIHGAMFTVRNSGQNDSVVVEWYGVMDQNHSDCTDRSVNLFGNGAQINNIATSKLSDGSMVFNLKSATGETYLVDINVYNWRNGPGCN